MFMMLEKASILLVTLCAGYITFILASKEEGIRKTLGRLLGMAVIAAALVALALKVLLLVQCCGLDKYCPISQMMSKHCGMKMSMPACGMRK
jgi:hypothetical protein